MELPVIYIFTHDSIGLGEDGPTHQPIEQLAALRAIPGLVVLRPADANETAEAWRVVLRLTHGPPAWSLTRQALPTLDRARYASGAPASPRAPMCWPTPRAGRRGDPDRHRAAKSRSASKPRRRWRAAGRSRPGGRRCPRGSCSRRSRRPTATQVLPPAITRARRGRGRLAAGLGPLRRGRRAR